MPAPSGSLPAPPARRKLQIAIVALPCLAAITLSACGSSVKPATGSRGRFDDPRTAHSNNVKCISQHHLLVQKVGLNELLIGPQPSGPKVVFEPTPGAAQDAQISGSRPQQGAEVLGSALLYPNAASDKEAATIENCLAAAVTG